MTAFQRLAPGFDVLYEIFDELFREIPIKSVSLINIGGNNDAFYRKFADMCEESCTL